MLTKDQIRGYLDSLNVATRIDDDGDLLIQLSADDDFGHDVFIHVVVDSRSISFYGISPGYEVPNPLFIANRSNGRLNYPTAVVRGDQIRMEYALFITEDVSDEYIKGSLNRILSAIWKAFIILEDENPNLNNYDC